MIDHIWTVICSRAVIDERSRNVSIQSVLEQIKVGVPHEPNFVLGIKLDVVSFWIRTDPNIPARGNTRLSLLAPSGENLGTFEAALDLSEYERGRKILHFDQLPIQSPGRHYFQIELRHEEETEWNTVAAIPLTVTFTPPENEEEDSQTEVIEE